MFPGYDALKIIRTTVDTPNQLYSPTGEKLAEIASQGSDLKVETGKGNFMGFIAYNEDKKDLAIIIRGAILGREWVQNVDSRGTDWKDNTDLTGENWRRTLGSEQYSLALYETDKPDPSLYLRLNGFIGLGVFLYILYLIVSSSLDLTEATSVGTITSAIIAYLQAETFGIVKQIIISGFSGFITIVALWLLLWNPILSLLAGSEKKQKVFQSGFSELYTTPPIRPEKKSLQMDVYNAINDMLIAGKEIKSITVSGHAQGASLTILAAHHAALTSLPRASSRRPFRSLPSPSRAPGWRPLKCSRASRSWASPTTTT